MWIKIVDMWITSVDNLFVKWCKWDVNISIMVVGKLKEKYLKTGIDEYLKRITAMQS